MIVTPYGKARSYLVNIKELKDMLKFAEQNYQKTHDDRIVIIARENGILGDRWVMDPDTFSKHPYIKEHYVKFASKEWYTNFDDYNLVHKVPEEALDITDWDSM